MTSRFELTASAIAVTAAVVLLVADSAAPQCLEYDTVDVKYAFETDCPRSTTSGIVHFQISPDEAPDWAVTSARLVQQAAAAGLLLEDATVRWDHYDCLGEKDGVAHPYGFDLTIAPANPSTAPEPGPGANGGFSCYSWDGELRDDQTLTCYPSRHRAESETCTLTLTHVD